MFAPKMIKELRTLAELSRFVSNVKDTGKTIGFVPTMGFLHKGHMSLIELSNSSCDVTIASIYVNPSQFNDSNDFDAYPRDEEADIQMLRKNNCKAVFIPEQKEIETLNKINVDLEGLAEVMEGKFRPGHFDGVVEIVYRLFSAVTPDKAFFGEKDFQQLMVIRKMVKDANLPVEIIGAPIIREENGLAMSSRNARLSIEGRENAGFLFQILKSYSKLDRLEVERKLAANSFELDYLEEHSLEQDKRLFVAGFYEGVRLIDNVKLSN